MRWVGNIRIMVGSDLLMGGGCYNWDMEKITTLVFDIGGIILDDTDAPLIKALGCSKERMAELLKMAFDGENWGKVMIGEYDQGEYMQEQMEKHLEVVQELKVVLDPAMQKITLPLRQENVEFLKELYTSGKYKMYWLSNMGDAEYDYLNEEGIIEMLDGGCFSNVEHSKKPWPEFYERLFAKYDLKPEECWFFDDKERNIVAGEKLGMRGTVVPSLGVMKEVVQEVLMREV